MKRPERKDTIWIHAASIGEGIIAENFIKYFVDHTEFKDFIITTNTYYTKALLEQRFRKTVPVFFLPFDFPILIKNFMKGSTFKILILVETEIWPNLIFKAKDRGIPVVLINGRISKKAYDRYRKFRFFFKDVFSQIDLALVQSIEAKERFSLLGIKEENIKVTGNLKYFREIKREGKEKADLIVFGSIKEKELEEIFPIFPKIKERFPSYTVFVAPRELSLVTIIERDLAQRFSVKRYSTYSGERVDFVVVDTVGDLMDLYELSKVAFVGGSLFPYGGQNILEPLFFGTPVIFGPYIDNFKEIAEKIIERGAGFMVKDGNELFERIKMVLEDKILRENMGKEGIKLIEEQKEVMKKTKDAILQILEAKNGGV